MPVSNCQGCSACHGHARRPRRGVTVFQLGKQAWGKAGAGATGQAKPQCQHENLAEPQHCLPTWCYGFAPAIPAHVHLCIITTPPLNNATLKL